MHERQIKTPLFVIVIIIIGIFCTCRYLAVTHNGARLIFARLVGGGQSNVAVNVNVAEAASLRGVASNVGAPCLTAGSDSSQSPVRQLVERALGVVLSSSPLPWFLYVSPSASSVYHLHQTRSRSFVKSSHWLAGGLSLWAAAEPVSACERRL